MGGSGNTMVCIGKPSAALLRHSADVRYLEGICWVEGCSQTAAIGVDGSLSSSASATVMFVFLSARLSDSGACPSQDGAQCKMFADEGRSGTCHAQAIRLADVQVRPAQCRVT